MSSDRSKQPPHINIKTLRMRKGLTLESLGKRCKPEVGKSSLSKIEAGYGYTTTMLETIAKALNVTVPQLFMPPELAPYLLLSDERQQKVIDFVADQQAAYKVERHRI